ncbi:hypothetical protein N7499_005791 [Penicillium canescens]|nr:hypothetical protein N7499_005791 [Penicillium canescens]
MHPTLNYRHSRRSACDKCRGQKLRCERGHINGMSCERCLKAQQPCITSISHPAPVFLPTSHDKSIVQKDRESQIFGHSPDLISMLPNSSGPKGTSLVLPSSTNSGMPNMLQSNSWNDQILLSHVSREDAFPSPADLALSIPLDQRGFPIPFESWGHQQSCWSNENYNLPPPETALPELTHHCSDESLYSPILGNDISINTGNKSVPTSQQPIYLGTAPFLGAEDVPESFWGNLENLPNPAELLPSVPTQEMPTSFQNTRKEILKLKIELLDDLDMLETDAVALASESLLNDLFNPSVAALDLPTYRMLNHSYRFFEMIQPLHRVPKTSRLTPAKSPTQSHSRGLANSTLLFQDVSDTNLDECATTISSNDSGYQTATTSSPDRTMITPSPICDIAVWLSVLEAHCYLVRIYRAIFTRLYQLFLIIAPADAEMYLLLPKLQLGQFHTDGNLAVQVQVLVDLCSSMMGQIDEVLELPPSSDQTHEEGEIRLPAAVGEGNWSTAIRDLVLAQEQDPCEMSLVDLMKCLRQLARDPAFHLL